MVRRLSYSLLFTLFLGSCEAPPQPLLPEQGRWQAVEEQRGPATELPRSGSGTGAGVGGPSGEVTVLAAGRDRQNQRVLAWILADRELVLKTRSPGEAWGPVEARPLPEGLRPSAAADSTLAVDADGAVHIAVLHDDGLAVYRWGAEAWERLGPPGALGGIGRGHGATLTFDPQNHPVVARRVGDHVGVWRWATDQWELVGDLLLLPGVGRDAPLGGAAPSIGFDQRSEPVIALRLQQRVRWRKAENGAREASTPQDDRYPVVVARHGARGWEWLARTRGSPLQDDPRRRRPATRRDDSVGDLAWAEIARESGPPAVTVDRQDRVTVAWTSPDRLLLYRYDGRRWGAVPFSAEWADHPAEPRFLTTPVGLRLAFTDRGPSEGRRLRVLLEGEAGWTEAGPVDGAAGDSGHPALTLEADGGLLAAWSERVAGADLLYARRLHEGEWTETVAGSGWHDLERRVAGPWAPADRPQLAYGADGGLILAWTELLSTGGRVGVQRWDGAAWSRLEAPRTRLPARRSLWRADLALDAAGAPSLLLPTRGGGELGLRVARWDGAAWGLSPPLWGAREAALVGAGDGDPLVFAHHEQTVGLYALSGEAWVPQGEPLRAGESRVEPAFARDATGQGYALWVDELRAEAQLGRLTEAGVERIPGLMTACDVDEQADVEGVALLGGGGGAGVVVGLTVVEGDGLSRYPLCRWTGEAWEPVPAVLPAGTALSGRPGGAGALSLASDGAQLFAAFELDTDAGRRVAVQRLREDGWTPLAGGGPAGEVEPCRGACAQPALVARPGELCLAWLTGGERADVVELRCHRLW